MRLLHTEDLTFKEFFDSEIPKYAILSHRWREGEVSHEDFVNNRKLDEEGAVKNGWNKILWFATLAREEYELEWCWIDTCCIDKKSSAELSEAINSMYRWYKRSSICIAYLDDVCPTLIEGTLERSEWFKRGWTLQELLAPSPKKMMFYDAELSFLGTKLSLASKISQITGIANKCFGRWAGLGLLDNYSVATRLSWASRRKTTRVEDEAYCLLGLLEVNMPLLYGEGDRAFTRLQHEIIKQSDDESIFAWTNEDDRSPDFHSGGMLAKSPRAFKNSGQIRNSKSETVYNGPRPRTMRSNGNPPFSVKSIGRPYYFVTHKGLELPVPRQTFWVSGNDCQSRYMLLQLDCFLPADRQSDIRWIFVLLQLHEGQCWTRTQLPMLLKSRISSSDRRETNEEYPSRISVGGYPSEKLYYTTYDLSRKRSEIDFDLEDGSPCLEDLNLREKDEHDDYRDLDYDSALSESDCD